MLKGPNITLRALEPEDIEVLFKWENDDLLWQVSNTIAPFSRRALEEYIQTAQYDIYTTKQLRLVMDIEGRTVGCIDLFEFDPNHRRAGLGIMVDGEYRGNGFASEALGMVIEYAFTTLGLHQLWCNIAEDNDASLQLFQHYHFKIVGVKKDWIRVGEGWKDEVMLQLVNR